MLFKPVAENTQATKRPKHIQVRLVVGLVWQWTGSAVGGKKEKALFVCSRRGLVSGLARGALY